MMALLVSFVVAVLFGASLFMMMKKQLFEVLIGTLLFTYGINLFLIAMGGWSPQEKPPIIPEEMAKGHQMADPLPQALILTAIVIAFGVTSFLVVLAGRCYEESEDVEFAERGEVAE